MKIKILTLNMEYGGSYLYDEFKNFSYLDDYIKIIKKNKIDVICFQEIILLHDKKPEINIAMRIAKKLGYYHASNEESYISIISRFPLKKICSMKKNCNVHKHNILCCIVDTLDGEQFMVCNIHLNDEPNTYYSLLGLPYNNTPLNVTEKQAIDIAWKGRKDDILELLDTINRNNIYPSIPTIICGDMNEPSHLDGKVEWKVSKTLYINGFTDIVRYNYPSYKKYPLYTCDLDTQKKDIATNPPMRIDMIYSRGLDIGRFKYMYRLKKKGIYMSDHIPILASFKL
jgi:exonuclease III